ncbi:MAG: hypothetical protein FJX77_07175, partial [Armatimonadetes bacterium]|nr:hypothetical protein [Armatimonadota bacterium]
MKMSWLALGALTLAGILGSPRPAAADWTIYGGNPEHQLFTNEKVTAPLGVLWRHTTNVYSKQGNVGGPVIQEGTVYFPSKNFIHAVDAASGELKWKAPEGDESDPNIPRISATPVINGDLLYVPQSDGALRVYNATNGQTITTFKTGGEIRCSPTLVGNRLYFGSDDDYLYCLDADNLSLVWKGSMDGRNASKLTDD